MGKVRMAQVLVRAGLVLGPTTIRRILTERDPTFDDTPAAAGDTREPGRAVRAKRPGDVWHVDLTTVPTAGGFWVPWSQLHPGRALYTRIAGTTRTAVC